MNDIIIIKISDLIKQMKDSIKEDIKEITKKGINNNDN